ncbi:VOC family protein [Pseudooceanicola sp.]|uniref:VOC family protein n=1 Tax=Pseudooceanicola sp. TaxID=1914328 RepID=UPI00405A3C07
MASQVKTCLWFDGDARTAAQFYVSLLPNSEITSEFSPDPAKPPLVIDFTLAGVPYMLLDAGPMFPQSEAVSIVVETDDQAETDRLWEALLKDGGQESNCGWLKDRWGVSWQITPKEILALMSAGGAKGEAAMAAVMKQVKLNVAEVRAAADAA